MLWSFSETFNACIQFASGKRNFFPGDLKIVRVTAIINAGNESEMRKYRAISVLPCFSKVLERIMCNNLLKYFKENEILCKKKFDFRERHSPEHA